MLTTGLVIFVFLFFSGTAMWVAFGLGSGFLHLFFCNAQLFVIPSYMIMSLSSWTLLCVPFFIVAGMAMEKAGLSKELVTFVDSWVGRIPGGLAITLVAAVLIFGAISGSGIAAVAAIGLIVVPEMLAKGYPKGYSIGLITAAAQLGVVIPPSIPMILFAGVTETSVAAIFMGGFGPGLLMAGFLMVQSFITGWRQKWPKSRVYPWRERWTVFVKALPALAMPVIILGGIYSGRFSPTEAAVVAFAYALLFGLLTGRMSMKMGQEAVVGGLRTAGMIFLLVATALVFGKIMIYARVPHMIVDAVAASGLSYYVFMFVIGMLYLILGCFAEVIIIVLVTVPILFPVMTAMGVNPIQFALIVTMAVVIAGITPPVGVNIFMASGIFDVPAGWVIKNVLRFYFVEIAALWIVVYWPPLTLWLPRLMGYA